MKIAIYGAHTRIRYSIPLITELMRDGHHVIILKTKSSMTLSERGIHKIRKIFFLHKKELHQLKTKNQKVRLRKKTLTLTSSEGGVDKFKTKAKMYMAGLDYKPNLNSAVIEGIRTIISSKVYKKMSDNNFLLERMLKRSNSRSTKRIKFERGGGSSIDSLDAFIKHNQIDINSASIHDMRTLAYKVKPNRSLIRQIKKLNLDVLIDTNLVFQEILDSELMSACKMIKVPTIYSVFSWDNLTTKASFAIEPDNYFVWNEFQKRELLEFHEVKNSVEIVGASRFDTFGTTASLNERFNSIRIMWLGSSRLGEPDDLKHFEKLLETLSEIVTEEKISTGIIVDYRMHFEYRNDEELINKINFLRQKYEEICVLLSGKDTDLVSAINESHLLFGMNTSAILEARLLGKEVIRMETSVIPEQEKSSHWKHIAKLCLTFSIEHVTEEIKRLDTKIIGRRTSWIELLKFIRPTECGIEMPARIEVEKIINICKEKPKVITKTKPINLEVYK